MEHSLRSWYFFKSLKDRIITLEELTFVSWLTHDYDIAQRDPRLNYYLFFSDFLGKNVDLEYYIYENTHPPHTISNALEYKTVDVDARIRSKCFAPT